MTNTAQRTVLIERVDAMSSVLDDKEVMLLRKPHDSIHVAGNTSIMHDDNDFRVLVDEWTDGVNGDIGVVGTTVGKHHLGTLTEEGDGRRHERIGRYDDLVTRMQLAEHGTHLQRISTRSGEKTFLKTVTLLEESMTAFGKVTITRHRHRTTYHFHIVEFTTRTIRFIKWNHCFLSNFWQNYEEKMRNVK